MERSLETLFFPLSCKWPRDLYSLLEDIGFKDSREFTALLTSVRKSLPFDNMLVSGSLYGSCMDLMNNIGSLDILFFIL